MRVERIVHVIVFVAVMSLVSAGVTARQSPASAETRLGAALHQEQVAGNLDAAISIYASIAGDPIASRPLKARALLQMAGCYTKLGRPEAVLTYQRVVNEYADTRFQCLTPVQPRPPLRNP